MKPNTHLAAVASAMPLPTPHAGPMPPALAAHLEDIQADGTLAARTDHGELLLCDCLEAVGADTGLAVGDRLLVVMLPAPARPVILGRIGRHGQPAQARIEASELVSIKCGESSIDLRADGKVVIRGDDVLVRAKGTKRIRAGAVSIN